jgi:pimeloyl-ACP methyl ester carboxylesterase
VNGFEDRGASAARRDTSGPIRIEALEGASPPMFVMRGGPRGPGRLVFLHGMCGHGLGYAQSFQFSAARFGTLIAPQADVSCGGDGAKWSQDIERLHERIIDTFRMLGEADPTAEITIIGMSQGATRAEALARQWPAIYTRLISMAAPQAVRARELTALKAAVTMAGELERQDLMKASAGALTQAGVPATYLPLPEATHGSLGKTPERTMREALTWIYREP